MCFVCAGLPKEAVQDVYKAAITKAGSTNTQQHLSNAFVAALTQIDDVNSGQQLLDSLLAAVEETIKSSGCTAAQKFTKGVLVRMRVAPATWHCARHVLHNACCTQMLSLGTEYTPCFRVAACQVSPAACLYSPRNTRLLGST